MDIDVFLGAGQSNQVGNGETAGPVVPPGQVLQVLSDGTIKDANDPIGLGAGMVSTGSPWPLFGISWYAATRRKIAFVPTAVDGTSQQAAADQGLGNWDAAGTLTANAITAQQNALTALSAAGYTPTFRGILWKQGERDSTAINFGVAGVSQAGYTSALVTMVGRFRCAFGAMTPFYMIRLGTVANIPPVAPQLDAPGFVQIRAAQDSYAVSDPYSFLIDHGAANYPENGMQAGIHYTQAGYNLMGAVTANAILGWLRRPNPRQRHYVF